MPSRGAGLSQGWAISGIYGSVPPGGQGSTAATSSSSRWSPEPFLILATTLRVGSLLGTWV